MAVVSQIRSSLIAGDDQPSPRIDTFQTMFLCSCHRTGKPATAACPCPSGPRNCGQSSASVGTTTGAALAGGADGAVSPDLISRSSFSVEGLNSAVSPELSPSCSPSGGAFSSGPGADPLPGSKALEREASAAASEGGD